MEETKTDPLVLPNNGIPDAVVRMMEKSAKPNPSRSLVFENDKQRNIGILKKGIQKPGVVSFDILRRAANAVPVARICVNTLKEKITKTKWLIKNIDPLADEEDDRIKKVSDLLKNPNPNDTFRSFLDKILEDLLVLDSVAIEKTRYPGGELARLFYVDASTIRPVFDEYGNDDIEIALPNGNTLPVSYLQIFNNSLYGGPESGDIVAAWAKQDFINFHMHPQGEVTAFGYGLSPLEGVLSVVNNLLNTDNYNGSYFDEGAFPPLIMQLEGQLDQRQLEAYREYVYGQIEGNFHRPAIMAGGGELKIHNLKDMTNHDMEFMEYTMFLAKLMAAAYGLSPQDIGLTDDVGSKNVSETQKDLSESKGYGSILNLLKEIFNNEILYKDFGYTDLEFEWIAEDSEDPEISSKIYDMALRNGTMTVNEVREKMGELPYEDWADQPLLLGTDGYMPIHFDSKRSESEDTEVAGETVYQKSISKSVYTGNGYKTWFDDRGFGQPFICQNIMTGYGYVVKPPVAVNVYSQGLEEKITKELSTKGLNVHPVIKMTFNEVRDYLIGMNADVQLEFDKYINMTPEYDSEKWRSRQGGSRKFPYYMTSPFVDGFALNSREMREDMKRDPASYVQAVTDLAALWNAEKEMMLGDRRADQYIITPDKRAFGFDYQFEGDQKRWEDSSTAISKVLIGIPSLYNLFMEKTKSNSDKKKSFKDVVKSLFN